MKTEEAVNYAGPRLDCEKTLLELEGGRLRAIIQTSISQHAFRD